MFEEAEEKDILEVYVKEDSIASFDDKIKNKLEKTGYDILSDQVFKKVSDTVTPQGIICILGIRNRCDIFPHTGQPFLSDHPYAEVPSN